MQTCGRPVISPYVSPMVCALERLKNLSPLLTNVAWPILVRTTVREHTVHIHRGTSSTRREEQLTLSMCDVRELEALRRAALSLAAVLLPPSVPMPAHRVHTRTYGR